VLRPFYILGEVNRPGEYPYVSGLTVLSAVATAGGFTYRANKRTIYVRHANEGIEIKTRIGAATQVRVGDTLRIVERYF
jgi:polysaccharide export outer membrane protein